MATNPTYQGDASANSGLQFILSNNNKMVTRANFSGTANHYLNRNQEPYHDLGWRGGDSARKELEHATSEKQRMLDNVELALYETTTEAEAAFDRIFQAHLKEQAEIHFGEAPSFPPPPPADDIPLLSPNIGPGYSMLTTMETDDNDFYELARQELSAISTLPTSTSSSSGASSSHRRRADGHGISGSTRNKKKQKQNRNIKTKGGNKAFEAFKKATEQYVPLLTADSNDQGARNLSGRPSTKRQKLDHCTFLEHRHYQDQRFRIHSGDLQVHQYANFTPRAKGYMPPGNAGRILSVWKAALSPVRLTREGIQRRQEWQHREKLEHGRAQAQITSQRRANECVKWVGRMQRQNGRVEGLVKEYEKCEMAVETMIKGCEMDASVGAVMGKACSLRAWPVWCFEAYGAEQAKMWMPSWISGGDGLRRRRMGRGYDRDGARTSLRLCVAVSGEESYAKAGLSDDEVIDAALDELKDAQPKGVAIRKGVATSNKGNDKITLPFRGLEEQGNELNVAQKRHEGAKQREDEHEEHEEEEESSEEEYEDTQEYYQMTKEGKLQQLKLERTLAWTEAQTRL